MGKTGPGPSELRLSGSRAFPEAKTTGCLIIRWFGRVCICRKTQFQQRTAKSDGAQPLRLPRSARGTRRPALPRGRRNAIGPEPGWCRACRCRLRTLRDRPAASLGSPPPMSSRCTCIAVHYAPALSDEDQELDPDRWCSHSAWGRNAGRSSRHGSLP
jgi:hypothetical protein